MAEEIAVFDGTVMLETVKVHLCMVGAGATLSIEFVTDDETVFATHTEYYPQLTEAGGIEGIMKEAAPLVQQLRDQIAATVSSS